MADAEQNRRIITVFGATGNQGGAVVRALVRSNKFDIRAVTRNPDSAKAKALQAIKCVSVVKADLDDHGSIPEAVKGAYGVYLVTNFWVHFSEEQEKKQIEATIKACSDAAVQHIVFSTLDNTKDEYTKFSKLDYVPHFQCKYDMEATFPENTTFLRTTAYYDNFIGAMAPKKNEDGTYSITMPMNGKEVYLTSCMHIGNVAAEAFLNSESKGSILFAVGDKLTTGQLAEIFADCYGKTVVAHEPSTAEYAHYFPEQGSEDMANMFQFYQESETFKKAREEVLSGSDKSISYPADLPFATWLKDNKSKLVLE